MKKIQPVLYAQFEQEKMEQFLGKKEEKGVLRGPDRGAGVGTRRRTNRRHRRSFLNRILC